jgi:hypothetical protein
MCNYRRVENNERNKKMNIGGKEYALTAQTEEERKGWACAGCDLLDTDGCPNSGRECCTRTGEVYKEVTK